MKLKEKYIARRSWKEGVPYEVWDFGNGYGTYISLGKERVGFGIHSPEKDITYEVAKYLDVDTNPANIVFGARGVEGRELYLSQGIDCVGLNYTKPENYMEILLKIEKIVNEHFKNKEKKE